MRRRLLWFLALPALALAFSAWPVWAEQDDSADAKAAIAKNGEAFIEAFHKGDAKALAAFWTSNGEYTHEAGQATKGRQAMRKNFAASFSDEQDVQITIAHRCLRMLSTV